MTASDTIAGAKEFDDSGGRFTLRISWMALLLGVAIWAGLIVFVILHVGEVERFARLLSQAKPQWLLLAALLQAATYLCAGIVWQQATRSDHDRLSLGILARLSIEQLSINQIVPTGGVSGNVVIFHALRCRGLPVGRTTEALTIEVLSGYLAYTLVALVAFVTLWFMGDVTRLISYAVGVFVLLAVAVVIGIVWFLEHKSGRWPRWLRRLGPFCRLQEAAHFVSTRRILNPRLLLFTSAINSAIFVLDGGTLWAMMQVAGAPIGAVSAFVAVVIAFIAGTISFLPGGLGGFEAGCIAMLTVFKVPLEAALAATLLFRGVTLWLPLLPGLVLARQDVEIRL